MDVKFLGHNTASKNLNSASALRYKTLFFKIMKCYCFTILIILADCIKVDLAELRSAVLFTRFLFNALDLFLCLSIGNHLISMNSVGVNEFMLLNYGSFLNYGCFLSYRCFLNYGSFLNYGCFLNYG